MQVVALVQFQVTFEMREAIRTLIVVRQMSKSEEIWSTRYSVEPSTSASGMYRRMLTRGPSKAPGTFHAAPPSSVTGNCSANDESWLLINARIDKMFTDLKMDQSLAAKASIDCAPEVSARPAISFLEEVA